MHRSLRLAGFAIALMSCVHHHGSAGTRLDFFAEAGSDNPWNRKIQNWQLRHQSDPAVREAAAGELHGSVELAALYDEFTHKVRRQIVADAVQWVQGQSHRFYRSDGEYDHWATLGEVIKTGGDDCDGLDLLTFVLLRRLGFAEHEIYRAIVVERTTGQHHMVTLWFDGGDRSNPFVLDPTGVVAREVVALSSVPQWEPIELFDEHQHYAVQMHAISDVASDD
jgi:transglutaminase-like putative cysteine protease